MGYVCHAALSCPAVGHIEIRYLWYVERLGGGGPRMDGGLPAACLLLAHAYSHPGDLDFGFGRFASTNIEN